MFFNLTFRQLIANLTERFNRLAYSQRECSNMSGAGERVPSLEPKALQWQPDSPGEKEAHARILDHQHIL